MKDIYVTQAMSLKKIFESIAKEKVKRENVPDMNVNTMQSKYLKVFEDSYEEYTDDLRIFDDYYLSFLASIDKIEILPTVVVAIEHTKGSEGKIEFEFIKGTPYDIQSRLQAILELDAKQLYPFIDGEIADLIEIPTTTTKIRVVVPRNADPLETYNFVYEGYIKSEMAKLTRATEVIAKKMRALQKLEEDLQR